MYFYVIVSIILGFLLIGFAIKLNVSHSGRKSIPFYLIGTCYIGVGIYGFFIPKEIDYVIIILMIVICILSLVVFNIFFKKSPTNNKAK